MSKLIQKIAFISLLVGQNLITYAQNNDVRIDNRDFEQAEVKPWIGLGIGDGIKLSNAMFHGGKQSLEIHAGSTAQLKIGLKPNSTYKITAWVRTNSGSDEVQLNVVGLGSNNVSAISALADWVKLEKIFVTDEGQKGAVIEVYHPETPSKSSAWLDDVNIEYIGAYTPVQPSGIQPLPARTVRTEMGISQQPLEKLNWLLDARFGMFIHWGLYSGLAKGEWGMQNDSMLPEEYRKLAYHESGDKYFAADKFNADQWAKIAKAAGMKYMSLTTQHHDGYALFDSKYINIFSSKQTHNRDFVKEYVDACRANGLKVGLYKTLINWRYPGYYDVNGTDCKKNNFGYKTDISHKENARLLKEEMYCLTKELVTKYGKIDQIFWDGGWLAQQGSDEDAAYFWESGKFLDPKNAWPVNPYYQDIDSATGKPLGLMGMVRKYQPDAIVNPRTGWYGDYKSEEGGSPITGQIRSEEIYEKCMSMTPAWGYTSAMEDPSKIISIARMKRMLSDCTIRNMALLLNVGPDRHGQITKPEINVLIGIGEWLGQVGEAIYGTRGGPWNPKDGQYGYAYKDNTIYLFLLEDFKGATFTLPAVNKGQKVVKAYMVDSKKVLKTKQNGDREIMVSNLNKGDKEIAIIAIELNKKVME
ncbi:MAG TPA: alpha-L-fucosidase [Paludibacter sp.]|nr:alpha-L-fucosidase [Paludibacter sp.]